MFGLAHVTVRLRYDLLRFGIVMLLAFGWTACSTSRPPEKVADERARVVGTWKYRADGISRLQKGTLQIMVQDGDLKGRLRDNWRGEMTGSVDLRGPYMEIRLDHVRISGRLHRDRFEAAVRREFYDVSRTGNGRAANGYFVARQVRSASVFADIENVGCPSLLREVSYTCSPFQSD
jgi:hypothetical protein